MDFDQPSANLVEINHEIQGQNNVGFTGFIVSSAKKNEAGKYLNEFPHIVDKNIPDNFVAKIEGRKTFHAFSELIEFELTSEVFWKSFLT